MIYALDTNIINCEAVILFTLAAPKTWCEIQQKNSIQYIEREILCDIL